MRKDKFAKFVCFVSCLFICFCAIKIFMIGGGKKIVASSFSGGSGTEASPYIIKTVADLNQLATDNANSNQYENKYFRLDADLNLNGATFDSIYHFENSTFDGNGHVIKNYSTTLPLFFCNHGSTIKNLGIVDVSISVPDRAIDGLYKNYANHTNHNYFGVIGGGVGNIEALNSIIYSSCFVDNIDVTVNQQTTHKGIYGGIFTSLLPSDSIVNDCYVVNSRICFNSSRAGRCVALISSALDTPGTSYISNCFVQSERQSSSGYFPSAFPNPDYTNIQNCYYELLDNNASSTNGATEKAIKTLTANDLSTDVYRNASAHPVLKIFDPEITITNSSGITKITRQNASSGINIEVSLSRTLNTQGQNDKVKIYIDSNPLNNVYTTTSGAVTIPQATLNNLSVDSHKITAKLVSDTDSVVKTSNELTLIVEEIPKPNIESITTMDNESSSSMFANEAPNGGLQLKVNLSREQLNLNGQDYEIGLYLDGSSSELGTLLGQAGSTTFTIPKNTLNSWVAGEHKITAKLLDDDAVVGTCAEDFVFVVHEDAYPEIERIDLIPTGHSQSQVDNLNSVSVTLAGKNFSPEYSVNLIFKNEASAEILNLSLGKFNRLSTTSETFNITGAKLQQIKELGIAKYSVEVEISK